MKITPKQILNNYYAGKKILGFQFGTNSEDRNAAIGELIVGVAFGFNDSREDAGLLFWVTNVDDPIFVYDNESLEIEETEG